MCGLCGVFGPEGHWSDTSGDFVKLGKGKTRRSQRSYQIQILNSILKQNGISVSDWQGTSYLVSNGKGTTEIAAHVSAIWSIIDKTEQRSFDPLDKKLLTKLSNLKLKK